MLSGGAGCAGLQAVQERLDANGLHARRLRGRCGPRLEPVEESPLETATGAVPGSVRRILTVVHDDRALGLLFEVEERGPVGVRELLSAYDLCESDLHGLLAELRAAGLIRETEIENTAGSSRGYETTERASDGLVRLRATADVDARRPGGTGE